MRRSKAASFCSFQRKKRSIFVISWMRSGATPAFSASKTVKMRRSLASRRRSSSGASVRGGAFSVSSPFSVPRTAFMRASSKLWPIAMTSPVAFICVPSFRELPANFSKGHFGNLQTT